MMESFFGSTAPIWAGVGAPIPLRAPEPVNYSVPTRMAGFDGPTAPTVGSLLAAVAIRRGQPAGPSTDAELEEFLYDCVEFLPGTGDVDIRCEGGRVTFSGTVAHKRQKRDVGEIAWSIPTINDVHNNVTIAPRRRARAQTRETEAHAGPPARKSA